MVAEGGSSFSNDLLKNIFKKSYSKHLPKLKGMNSKSILVFPSVSLRVNLATKIDNTNS